MAAPNDFLVSSIPLRTDSTRAQQRVDELNSVLQGTSTTLGTKLILNDTSFRLAEHFNSTMMKVIRIAEVERKPWKEELQKFLFQYRTTPHTVTGVSPVEMLMGRKLRNKLPKRQMRAEPMDELQWQIQIRERDARRKRYEKDYADKKMGANVSDIEVGDRVILRQSKRNKLTTRFEKEPYDVVDQDGNALVIQRGEEPRKMRNIAHMKKRNGCPETSQGQTMTSVLVGKTATESANQPCPFLATWEPEMESLI